MTPSEILVHDVMVANPATVPPTEPLRDVIRRMDSRQIGAVLVCEGGRLDGIFTERDLLTAANAGKSDWSQPVRLFMSGDPTTIAPDAGWEEAAALMERLRVRHLPVVDRGTFVGIVSARDLIAARTNHLDRLVAERTAQLGERDAQMRHNMEVAGRLMDRLLLPGAPPDWPELSWGVHYRPLDQLGGDYYDFAQPDRDHLGVLIADASGHSLPAALVAIMARIAFAETSRRSVRPGAVLAAMNARLQGLADERYVTAFYGVYDRRSRVLTYANAGHPPPLHYSTATRIVLPVEGRGFMLGIVPEAQYEEATLTLAPGDRLCLYTDGAPDSQSPEGMPFGVERMAAVIATEGEQPAAVLMQQIVNEILSFRGTRAAGDDCTLLVAEVR
ncbi:MAG: SpoIIE family protein phosphatase [Gemmataceae bacterium]